MGTREDRDRHSNDVEYHMGTREDRDRRHYDSSFRQSRDAG